MAQTLKDQEAPSASGLLWIYLEPSGWVWFCGPGTNRMASWLPGIHHLTHLVPWKWECVRRLACDWGKGEKRWLSS
jgi:hypothetical protein